MLLNAGGNNNHRVLFKLVGARGNKMAIGARVTVRAGTLVQFSEVRGGGSYLSQNDPRLHFGLGPEPGINEVEMRWANGNPELLKDLPADNVYTLVEGEGIKDKVALSSPAVRPN